MDAFLKVVRDLALLVARIVLGVTLMAHGWYRWNITGLEDQTNILEGVGLPSAEGLVIATIAFELIGGALLIFGLATPLIGLGMIVQNGAVMLTTRLDAGFYQHDRGWEYNAVLATFGLIFLAFGSGRAGLDYLFLRPRDDAGERLIEPDPRDRPASYPVPDEPATGSHRYPTETS
ncbi:DoxX family protein [Tessaracoccus sp. ZS01]|uniref:DoxX family protein n=1 Tax=Tessaracoccus sp. ZS01 TaxID=1906324 RepID=UPI00096E5AC3|nr:DoxX family protein [Tessaracoccus sp. ZS01]MCG6568269.1 DoxX family protein [Tessaracoccus sp. ZS01]OMG53360.1 hypothetical protein BJN44_11670 [Tessaracoccus sp. ZS01]